MSEKAPLRVRYEYEVEPETRLRYAHGVWGGINPQGEVEISFYAESDKMPAFSECVVSPDGTFGPEMAPYDEEQRVVVRQIHSKIVLSYPTARAMLEWLEDKVNILEDEEEGASPMRFEGGPPMH